MKGISRAQKQPPWQACKRGDRLRREGGGQGKPRPQPLTAIVVELGHHLTEGTSIKYTFAELPVKHRRHLDLSDHSTAHLPERLGELAHRLALGLVEVELRDVRGIEIAHEGEARSRSSEIMVVLSVPRPSLPLRRAYPGRTRRA